MAGVWYGPERPAFATFAGGQATLGEIFSAAHDASVLLDNTFAAQAAMEEAYDRRNRRIFDLTGETLDNPYRLSAADVGRPRQGSIVSWPELQARQEADWRGKVRDLAARRPELAGQLMPAETIEEEALAVSRDAEHRFSLLAGSRDGAGKWLAALAGGAAGSLRDPVQLATLFVGGGPGAARTVTGRILATALSEAAVNAGVELALQPAVQAYRARAGLESGVDEALKNAGFAALVGGALGGAGRSLAELLSSGGRAEAQALAAGLDNAPPALRAEIEARLPEASAALRETLPPAARGALDQAEQIAHLDGTRPVAASAEHHDVTVAAAHRAAQEPESFAGFAPDPAQVERVTATITGPAPAKPAKEPPSLLEFLKARGGVLDDKGELAAIGAGRLAEKQRGKPDRRVSLDYAREAAEEAGYIGRAGETQVTTIADLLDAIDTELRGTKVFSREDQSAVATFADFEVERARLEGLVAEVIGHAGPAVDDRLVIEASELALRDGLDAFDAVESVLTRAESRGRTKGFDDTRGQGQRYHGSPAPIEALAEGHYETMNIYGQGFYSSDAIDIVHGYANRKGAQKPSVYRVAEREPVPTFDMEQPVPDWLTEGFDQSIVHVALAERPASVRQLYDEMRAWSRAEDVSADELQEIFDAFRYRMEEHGYRAMRHVGGLQTGRAAHEVTIYFSPERDLELQPVDTAGFREPAHTESDTLPGWSHEVDIIVLGDRGVDEPGKIEIDEMYISERDFVAAEEEDLAHTLPIFADRPDLSLAALRDELKAEDALRFIAEACRA